MSASLLVGIDVGTTGVKALICERDGTVLAQSGQEYPTTFAQPGWAEQDPDAWWKATCAVVHKVIADAGASPQAVAALGVSCQAPTLVAVDAAGAPVHPALIWMDRRSEQQCERLRATIDEAAILRINGGRIDPYFLAPKILWLRDEAPDAYAHTHQILQANGYIVHRLTGAFCMDNSHGPLTLFFDSDRQEWSTDLIAAMGIDPAKLPPVVPCAQVVGTVTPAAAAATGLAPDTPVIAGMADGTAASIEVGLVRAGSAAEMTGQSLVIG